MAEFVGKRVAKRGAEIRVHIAWACPDAYREIALSLPPGATLQQAIAASGIAAHLPAAELAAVACGIWGKIKPRDQVLRDGDRVELYRPLQADPKDARRAKAANAKRR